MTDVRRKSWADRMTGGPAFVVLSLVGLWVGHTIQYAIGHGTAGLGPMLGGSAHLYLVPVGALLATIVFAASVGWARALAEAERRLAGVRGALTGQRVSATDLEPAPSAIAFQPLRLWLMLAGSGIALYVFQENTEAGRVHLPTPGLAVLTGRHWTAIPVFCLVALVLVAIVGVCQAKAADVISHLSMEVERLHALVRATLAVAPLPHPALRAASTPLERWGRQLWARPPPAWSPA